MMTQSQKRFLYSLFTLTLLLILSYAALDLMAATRYLLPNGPLSPEMLPTVQSVAYALRETALLLGFIAGGLHIAIQSDLRLIHLPLHQRLWHQLREFALLRVWLLGLLLVLIGSALMVAPLPLGWQSVIIEARLYMGYLLMGLAVAFWLMTRFSNVMLAWVLRGLRNTGLMLSVAGLLLSIAPLSLLNVPLVIVVPGAYMIFAAHSHRALSDPNSTKTLAAYWLAIGVLLLSIGAVLATVLSLSGVQPYLENTPWRDLQHELATMGLLAWMLGLLNQAIAELREHHRRITGFIPVWTISSGILGGGFVLALISVVSSYALHLFAIPDDQLQPMLTPLYFLWIGSKLLIAVGLSVYGLQYYARRIIINPDQYMA
jgi:hypothetical protein